MLYDTTSQSRYDRFISKHCESGVFTFIVKANSVKALTINITTAILFLFTATLLLFAFLDIKTYDEIFSNIFLAAVFIPLLIVISFELFEKLSLDATNARLKTENRLKYIENKSLEPKGRYDRFLLKICINKSIENDLSKIYDYLSKAMLTMLVIGLPMYAAMFICEKVGIEVVNFERPLIYFAVAQVITATLIFVVNILETELRKARRKIYIIEKHKLNPSS